MAKVQVLGTGCVKCGYLLKNAQTAASERQAGDIVEKIDDIMQVLEFNPFSAFFKKITIAETWLRRIAGGSVLAVGIYISVQQIYLS